MKHIFGVRHPRAAKGLAGRRDCECARRQRCLQPCLRCQAGSSAPGQGLQAASGGRLARSSLLSLLCTPQLALTGWHTSVCSRWFARAGLLWQDSTLRFAPCGLHASARTLWFADSSLLSLVCRLWFSLTGMHTPVCSHSFARSSLLLKVCTFVCSPWFAHSSLHALVCSPWFSHSSFALVCSPPPTPAAPFWSPVWPHAAPGSACAAQLPRVQAGSSRRRGRRAPALIPCTLRPSSLAGFPSLGIAGSRAGCPGSKAGCQGAEPGVCGAELGAHGAELSAHGPDLGAQGAELGAVEQSWVPGS